MPHAINYLLVVPKHVPGSVKAGLDKFRLVPSCESILWRGVYDVFADRSSSFPLFLQTPVSRVSRKLSTTQSTLTTTQAGANTTNPAIE